jgi:Flp pilus assembly protein TadD
MAGAKRTAADWVWTVVGFLGVACILVALYMLLFGSGNRSSPEAGERARELRAAAKEKLENGDAHGALRDLARAETLSEREPEGFDDEWRTALAREILAAQAKCAEQRWSAGTAKLDDGNASAAVEDFEAAVLHSRGRNPRYFNDLGEALWGTGEEDRARQAWLDAIRLQPVYAKPYLNLARWHEKRGNLRAALSRYRAAVAFHPEPVPATLTDKLSELLEGERAKLEKESETYRERFRANPADWEAFNHLLWRKLWTSRCAGEAGPTQGLRNALLSVGEDLEDLQELRARQETAVADRPGSVVDRAGLGAILLLHGEFERAKDVFSEALSLSESDRTSLLGRGLAGLLAEAGDDSEIQRVAESLQTNLVAWIALGAHLVQRSEAELACSALATALRLDAGMPEVYRLLALAFTGEDQRQNREAARKAYERITGS